MTLNVRPIVWLGDSEEEAQGISWKSTSDIGAALFAAQCGETAEHVKPFKGNRGSRFEIVERYNKDADRLVHGVQIEEKVYVLHAFQKKI